MNYSGASLSASAAPLQQVEYVQEALSKRQVARIMRDRERGYSINSKQIVLAFMVEFVIIGLILTNIYVTVAQLPDPSTFKTVQALLFPIAMAMVELARVPLAVAVRTQNSWNIKFAALFGVLCAVAVTSNSLYSIGASSFTPRLEETHQNDVVLSQLRDRKRENDAQIAKAQADAAQKLKERDAINQSIQALNKQLTEQPTQNCAAVTIPSPAPGAPATSSLSCKANPVLKTLNAEIAAAKIKLAEAEGTLKQAAAQIERASEGAGVRTLNEEITKAQTQNRESIFQSQLHSLAAMLFGVDPQDVTPGQIKSLEFYLIFVSSIAAAFSSTLIAMTAVRRIKKPREAAAVTIPDEAAAYLFGPLVAAIRKEAVAAVAAAANKVPGAN